MKGPFLMRLARRDDDGFTLVETLVALLIATIVFTSLAYVAMGALRASLLSRTNQQATDLATQRLEQVRDLPYSAVAMDPNDLSGDPGIIIVGGVKSVRLGDGSTEPVYSATGGITPHVVVQDSTQTNQVTFTLKTYVTTPVDSLPGVSYRRVSVHITWQSGSQQLSRWVTSLVSFTQRGLPLPVFKLTPLGSTSITVTANDSYAVYGFDITNQGARDRWDLSMNGSRSWSFYADNGDGVFDPLTDVLLTDTSGNALVDTGWLSPTQSLHFWVASLVTTGTPATATALTQTLTAQSVAQPLAATGTSTASTTLSILAPGSTAGPTPPGATNPPPAANCPAATVPVATASGGYSLVPYTLLNRSAANPAWPGGGTIGSTSTLTQGSPLTMAVETAEVPAGQLPAYSSNISADGGRVIVPESAGDLTKELALTDTTKFVDWRSNVDKKAYGGSPVLQLWAGATTGYALSSVSLTAQLYKWRGTTTGSGKNAVTTYAAVAVGAPVVMTVPSFTCAGMQQITAKFGAISISPALKASEFLGVRLWNSGGTPVRIAYDVVGDYPSTITLPEK